MKLPLDFVTKYAYFLHEIIFNIFLSNFSGVLFAYLIKRDARNVLLRWRHWATALFEIVYIVNRCLVDLLLHHIPHYIIDKIQIWTVRRPKCGRNEVWCVSF